MSLACRTAVRPDDRSAGTLRPQQAWELLPLASRVSFAVRVSSFEELLVSSFGMNPDQITELWQDAPPVIADLFGPELVDGLDRDGRYVVALSTAGHESWRAALRESAALDERVELPREVHVRVIVETPEARAVASRLMDRCAVRSQTSSSAAPDESRCRELVIATPYEGFLSVDFFWREGGLIATDDPRATSMTNAIRKTPAIVASRSAASPSATATPAWRAFVSSEGVFTAHAAITDLFDLGALSETLQLSRALKTVREDDRPRLQKSGLEAIRAGLTFDSAEVTEVRDFSLSLREADGLVFFDALGSLTDYGAELARLGRVDTMMQGKPGFVALFDLRWAFALEAATTRARLPAWAERPSSVSQRDFVDHLRARYRDAGAWVNLMYLQYPVTMLKVGLELDNPFIGLPSGTGTLEGVHLRAGLRPGATVPSPEHLVGALAIRSGPGHDDGPLEALLPILGDFGIATDSRASVDEGRRTYLVTIGARIEELFEELEDDIEAGTRLFVDVAGLQVLGQGFALRQVAEGLDREGFVSRYPRLFYMSRTVGDQWFLRLQLGGDTGQVPGPARH
jgi:hypothetical protein